MKVINMTNRQKAELVNKHLKEIRDIAEEYGVTLERVKEGGKNTGKVTYTNDTKVLSIEIKEDCLRFSYYDYMDRNAKIIMQDYKTDTGFSKGINAKRDRYGHNVKRMIGRDDVTFKKEHNKKMEAYLKNKGLL